MQRELAVRARRSCLRVNPLPVSRCLPWDSPSETIWALWGGENIVRAVTVSLRGTLVSTWVLFSWCLSRAGAPGHRQRLAFGQRRNRSKNSKTKVRRRTERRRQQQRGGKFQRASLMFFSYTRINCRYSLAIDKPIKQQSLQKLHFSAFVDLATEVSLYCHFGD